MVLYIGGLSRGVAGILISHPDFPNRTFFLFKLNIFVVEVQSMCVAAAERAVATLSVLRLPYKRSSVAYIVMSQ